MPDSLAIGLVIMLIMTIVQRGVGFVRSVWLCKLLDDYEVGLWSLSYVFLCTATPMVLFGLPGSLPRYVEHYRQRGHLQDFIRRIVCVTAFCCTIFLAIMLAGSQPLAWLIYSDESQVGLVFALSLAAIALIAFFVVNELVSSLRQVKTSSIMYFLQGVLFTLVGITCLYMGGGIRSLIISFAITTAIALIPGLVTIFRGWSSLDTTSESFDQKAMWRKLLPYAAALWAMNLLTNAFGMVDRGMIMHLYPGSEFEAQSAVGQYHSSRIFAVLLMSLASMVAGVLMPYLTADWEQGKREVAKKRIRQATLLMSVLSTIGAAAVMLVAPWLFSSLLENRYTQGLELMPMAFAMCTWGGLTVLIQSYVLLIERGKYLAIVFGLGLLVNIVLNYLFVPTWGLTGAVVATLISTGLTLAGIFVCNARMGLKFDPTSYYSFILPATILFSPLMSLICVVLVILVNPTTKDWIHEGAQMLQAKLKRGRLSRA